MMATCSLTTTMARIRSPVFAASTGAAAAPTLPTKPIPGSYGPPLIGAFKDRLDYFWFQGPETFFKSRIANHKSTVFRTNMPPTFPFFIGVDPRVIVVTDTESFSVLFDLSLVDKKNVLIGDYMPSLSFTGGTRVSVYQDVSEPGHTAAKNFCFDLLKRSASEWVSSFLYTVDNMFDGIEKELDKGANSVNFFVPLQKSIFYFLTKSIVGADPEKSPDIADKGFAYLDTWLAVQLLPTIKIGLFQPLEEILIHSFPLPFFLVSGGYKKLYDFIESQGQEVINIGKTEYGLSKEDAINNILFVLGFNAYGGFSIFLPILITTVARDKTGLKDKLRNEVRSVMESNNATTLNFKLVQQMELVRSTVYEVLRLNPPVPLQYGRARTDFTLRSHDSEYKVVKGELLCGYQPLAMQDSKVFERPAEFVPDRFTGSGKELLKYLFWSNGPQTGMPSVGNKQCAAKDYVVDTACMLVAEIFNRYDEFVCDESSTSVTKLVKRSDK